VPKVTVSQSVQRWTIEDTSIIHECVNYPKGSSYGLPDGSDPAKVAKINLNALDIRRERAALKRLVEGEDIASLGSKRPSRGIPNTSGGTSDKNAPRDLWRARGGHWVRA
jgi:hypothetical protein